MRKMICFLMLLFFESSFLFSGEIYVTKIKKTPVENKNYSELATIVINNCIEIRDIKVIKNGGKVRLVFPTYVSKKDLEYSQVKLLTQQANSEVNRAIITAKPSNNQSETVIFGISKFALYKGDSALKVFAAVDFNDAVRVECKIMQSYRNPWVAWPAEKLKNGEWKEQIIISKKELCKKIEKTLLERYRNMIRTMEED